ncbi:PREDICTED: auxin response factor 17-like [Camelina sativa]|uniref:Auxin response factor n=1 Tax=Camelina sativa TaxID=90675 RepID=A0ABM0SVI5_CAMSA|nr:PREDICTED: auxin response factor 17-like [Camelina sativa]
MSPPSDSAAGDILHRGVDPMIWRACAGASVQIPLLYSRVYYFPQGHVEHCCPSSPLVSTPPPSTSPVPCLISSIQLLADPITDEVFAHLLLQPVSQDQFVPTTNFSRFAGYEGDVVDNNNKVTTFAKILTPSDANNGGGFSVPRYCADSVFPLLDFAADPPVQKLFITDIHGAVWDFRHIYRGTPRRHLLTTGWSKFVNGKKLIAGDSVVFMRKSHDEMFIGVRRAPISSSGGGTSYYGGDEYNGYYSQSNGFVPPPKEDDGCAKKTFRRSGLGKLTAEAVSEAMNRAAKGLPFEVVFYPTAGWSDFVVRAEDVESSMSMYWTSGTRVKMAMETEDSSRITWFQGIVSSTYQETGPWRGSPWKQLQITWDEPEILQNVKRVNPWQVEMVANATQLHASFPPAKRLKYPHTGGFLSGDDGEIHYPPQRGLSSAAAPDSSPYMFPYTTFPAGMQGARQYEFGSYNPTGFIGENPPQLSTNNFFSALPGLEKVSTEKNFGSQPSDNLSPNSNTTNQSSGNDLVGNRGPTEAKANSIKLFGKTITVQEPSESGPAESGLCEEDGSKESSDNTTQLSLTPGPKNP